MAEDFPDRGGEIIYARAGHDDRVPAPVRFLGNPKEFTTLVLAKLDVETLSLDLELFCFDDAVHFSKTEQCMADFLRNGSKFSRHLLRKTLNWSGFYRGEQGGGGGSGRSGRALAQPHQRWQNPPGA